MPETGFATYRVNVLLPSREPYALKIPDIGTTYELFVDGVSLAKVGEPGNTRESTSPRYYPTTVSFVPKTRRVEIVVHVANFHFEGFFDTVGLYEEDHKEVMEHFTKQVMEPLKDALMLTENTTRQFTRAWIAYFVKSCAYICRGEPDDAEIAHYLMDTID